MCKLVEDGSYSDMLTVLCLSSVLQKPIQTHWPVMLPSSPFTKLVVGRNVETVQAIDILWTIHEAYDRLQFNISQIDHFVPLIAKRFVTLDAGDVQDNEVDEAGTSNASADDVQLNIDAESVPIAIGGQSLARDFLSTKDCVQYLTDACECLLFRAFQPV